MTASSRPVATLATVTRITLKVVTLMPPPVPPGAAPMNIRMHIMHFVMVLMPARSTVLKPAVRALTDWNRLFTSLSPTPMPPRVTGLYHSKNAKLRVPPTMSSTVQNKTTLVCRVRCFVRRHCARSCQTKKPSPPAMIRNMITACTYQLAV